MRIITKSDSLHADKPEGLSVNYYLFDEYEIHHDTQAPHTIQIWHHHETVWETIVMLSGELIATWKEDGQEIHQVVTSGDVIETQRTSNTFLNNSDQPAQFLVIKQFVTGQNKSDILKNDKVVDQTVE